MHVHKLSMDSLHILIFSPVSGGMKNPSNAIDEIKTHGSI